MSTVMKNILILFLALLSIQPIRAQDSAFTRQIIRDLSSPVMFGRGHAYSGDSIAAEYIKNQFIAMGVPPLGEDYFQRYSFPGFAMEGKVSIAVEGNTLNPLEDFLIAPFSKTLKKNDIPIIKADPIILLHEKKMKSFLKKYKEQLSHSLLYFDIANCNFENENDLQSVITALQNMSYFVVDAFGSLGFLIGVKELPVCYVSNTHYERDFACIYVLSQMMSENAKKININYTNNFGLHHTQNVCAMTEGVHYPDSFVVFMAHYDHLGMMGDEVIFHGVHDNASGVATVLNIANFYSLDPLPYTAVYCLFSGEEAGLRGSTFFVENPPIDLSKIKIALNLDMLCGGDNGAMIVNGMAENTKLFYETMAELNEQRDYLPEVRSRPNAPNSDHYPFTQHGVPAVFMYVYGGTTGKYHHHTDTNDRCPLDQWENIFKLIRDTIAVFTNSKCFYIE